MKQVYKIYIETWSEFQSRVWLQNFHHLLEAYKQTMESKHKNNHFIYNKKNVVEHRHLFINEENFCLKEEAEKYKQFPD